MRHIELSSVAVALAVPALAIAAQTGPPQAAIPFATTTGIESWRAVGNDTLYIKSRRDQWYKADLFGPCIGLQFDPAIGFVVRYGSSFDRTSSILVDGRECKLSSLIQVEGPPMQEKQQQSAATDTAPRNPDPSGSAQQRSASIPFADLGSIEDWQAVSDEVLYIEGRNEQWYRATLFAPCTGLTFENTIGFAVEPSGAFDRFSSIVVDGRECHLKSLTRSDAPPGSRQAAAE